MGPAACDADNPPEAGEPSTVDGGGAGGAGNSTAAGGSQGLSTGGEAGTAAGNTETAVANSGGASSVTGDPAGSTGGLAAGGANGGAESTAAATTGAGASGGSDASGGSSTTGQASTSTSTSGGGTGAVLPDLDWQCDGDACVPGAACDMTTGNCECADGFAGDGWWCLSSDACADAPCQNGGTCHPTIGDRYLCTCSEGYGGVHCELSCAGEIEFPDAAFASAVRSAALLDAEEPITAQVLSDVRSLSVYDTPIADLTGIECMTALSWVTMHTVGLTDLTPFAALPRLTQLRADCNQITDLTPVASLINLVDFSVGKSSSCEVSGKVTDISPLQDLVGLTSLDLSGQDISSLASLSSLSHLTWLILANNPNLSSLDGIENADYLRYFVVTDTQVSDVSMFAGHSSIETLYLSGSNVADLTPLLTASTLQNLHIRVTAIDCDAQAANIAALAGNGVTVNSDCL
jgi:hypothetical protein